MSDLSDRLRTSAVHLDHVFWHHTAAMLREAAGELDRLDSILGEATHYTDVHWGAHVAADTGLAAAVGYWERHLAETGGR